jgi:hypothetical protein
LHSIADYNTLQNRIVFVVVKVVCFAVEATVSRHPPTNRMPDRMLLLAAKRTSLEEKPKCRPPKDLKTS